MGSDNRVRVNAGTVAGKKAAPEVLPESLAIHDDALAQMKPVGMVMTEGSEGRASVDFPSTSGRYVMMKWNPAEKGETSFSVAEIAAFGDSKQSTLLAANVGRGPSSEISTDGKDMVDAKDRMDSKDKDMPAEGPAAPAEGPPPGLPQPPPFVLIPEVLPTSP
jgi:hypothetical protein